MNGSINHWQEGIPSHHSWNPSGAISYWCKPDTEENFKKNPNSDYINKTIIYTFNNFGFRTRQFDFQKSDKKNILCFGCSHTEGTGVQTPWPEIIQEQLPEYTVYNLGHTAGSSDTVARLITNWVPILKPEKVIILWPAVLRYELYDKMKVKHIGAWTEEKELIALMTNDNVSNWFEKNKIYVKMFSQKYNFQIFEDFSENWIYPPHLLDRARDNTHFGLKTHNAVANNFLNKIIC